MNKTISACMIVKDEENALPGCFESIENVVDEVVVVDTESTDRTMEIAKEYGAAVYEHEWKGHFGEARNVSFDKATSDWILYIDADERLSEDLRVHLRELIQTDENILYKVPIKDEILDCCGPENGMVRIFKKGAIRYHESEIEGPGAPNQRKNERREGRNSFHIR